MVDGRLLMHLSTANLLPDEIAVHLIAADEALYRTEVAGSDVLVGTGLYQGLIPIGLRALKAPRKLKLRGRPSCSSTALASPLIS
jgi:hypothetical protein